MECQCLSSNKKELSVFSQVCNKRAAEVIEKNYGRRNNDQHTGIGKPLT